MVVKMAKFGVAIRNFFADHCSHESYVKYSPVIRNRLHCYFLLMRIDKPIGIFLLLWPALWALWIAAEGLPSLKILLIFTCGTFLMRSSGVVLNDIADRHFDSHVKRTKDRVIATRQITPLEALCLAGGLIFLAFCLVLNTNRLTVELSMVAFILAAAYPFMKRFTYLPQFFLGLAFGWSVPMAFAAQTGTIPVIAWVILISTILWTVTYDTMYAIIDREDDIQIGIKSTAILLGDTDRLSIAIMQILLSVSFLIVANYLKFGIWFYIALVVAVMVQGYQIWLLKDKNSENCMKAFLSNNWYGAVIFLGIFAHYL